MTLPADLLDILCCPSSHQPLLPLSAKRLARLNQEILNGEVVRVDHEPAQKALTAALITRDGKLVYPVESGIPVLLSEQAIATVQFEPPL